MANKEFDYAKAAGGFANVLRNWNDIMAQRNKIQIDAIENNMKMRDNFMYKMLEQKMEQKNRLQFVKEAQQQFRQTNQEDGVMDIGSPTMQVSASGEPGLKYPSARDKEFNIKLGMNRIALKESKGIALSPAEQRFKENYSGMSGREDRLTKNMIFSNSTKLRQEFLNRPETKEYININTQVRSMDALLKKAKEGNIENKVALDQGLITMYNKLTDPNSVVRESEYARTPENLPLANRFSGALQKLQKGGAGLTNSDREALIWGAKVIANERGKTYNETLQGYTDLAGQNDIDVGLVTRGLKPHQDYELGGAQSIKSGELQSKIEQARSAGYTDEQINAYLKQKGLK